MVSVDGTIVLNTSIWKQAGSYTDVLMMMSEQSCQILYYPRRRLLRFHSIPYDCYDTLRYKKRLL